MIEHNVEQKSLEWFKLRELKMTASEAQAIGNNGKGLESYITKIMATFYSGGGDEKYSNEKMERGNEYEGFAREIYELKQGVNVREVGFIEIDENLGCSPDGLIEDDGLLEIKSCNYIKHYEMIRDGKPDSKYVWQCQMQLFLTGRKWCDLVYYHPNFKENLVIFRIEPDEEKFEKLKLGIEKGKKLISEQLK